MAADPTEHLLAPKAKQEVPYIDFSALLNALSELEQVTKSIEKKSEKLSAKELDEWNQKVYRAEQQLLTSAGLPRRPWYRHTLYAPGFYTGYGVKTIPGVREAIEQHNYKEANEQIQIVADSIKKLSNYLNN